MQTINVNNRTYADATVFGPFFVEDSPGIEVGGDMAFGAPGEPCWVEGTVTGADGDPLAGARIEVWEADENGRYDVQYDAGKHSHPGRAARRRHLEPGTVRHRPRSLGGLNTGARRPMRNAGGAGPTDIRYPLPVDAPIERPAPP